MLFLVLTIGLLALIISYQYKIVFNIFRIRLMSWNQKRGAWNEGAILNFRNLHTITALAWKPDGTTIIAVIFYLEIFLLKINFCLLIILNFYRKKQQFILSFIVVLFKNLIILKLIVRIR